MDGRERHGRVDKNGAVTQSFLFEGRPSAAAARGALRYYYELDIAGNVMAYADRTGRMRVDTGMGFGRALERGPGDRPAGAVEGAVVERSLRLYDVRRGSGVPTSGASRRR